MSNWQPIETAKDETSMDVWAVDDTYWQVSKRFCNVYKSGNYWLGVEWPWQPTHWMPLPEPPEK